MCKDEKSNNLSTKSPKAISSKRLSIALSLVALAQLMVIVDFTIVQVALPSIGREFGVSINGLQWIVTAYDLTLAGFVLFSGRSGDPMVYSFHTTRNNFCIRCSLVNFVYIIFPHDKRTESKS